MNAYLRDMLQDPGKDGVLRHIVKDEQGRFYLLKGDGTSVALDMLSEDKVVELIQRIVPSLQAVLPYIHLQPVQSTVWVCEHGMGRKPASIRVLLNNTEECEGEPLDINENVVQITFLSAISGLALIF